MVFDRRVWSELLKVWSLWATQYGSKMANLAFLCLLRGQLLHQRKNGSRSRHDSRNNAEKFHNRKINPLVEPIVESLPCRRRQLVVLASDGVQDFLQFIVVLRGSVLNPLYSGFHDRIRVNCVGAIPVGNLGYIRSTWRIQSLINAVELFLYQLVSGPHCPSLPAIINSSTSARHASHAGSRGPLYSARVLTIWHPRQRHCRLLSSQGAPPRSSGVTWSHSFPLRPPDWHRQLSRLSARRRTHAHRRRFKLACWRLARPPRGALGKLSTVTIHCGSSR